jgi:nucleoid DNA-binding protein
MQKVLVLQCLFVYTMRRHFLARAKYAVFIGFSRVSAVSLGVITLPGTTDRNPMMAIKKAAPKKKAAAKPAAKKTAAKKVVAAAPKKAAAAVTTKLSKSQVLTSIAETTELSRKQVSAVFDEIEALIARSIGKKGLGEFTLPGLLKITTVKKPARKARKGINPFTGEETMFKAKPASVAVKVRPLKKLKAFVEA